MAADDAARAQGSMLASDFSRKRPQELDRAKKLAEPRAGTFGGRDGEEKCWHQGVWACVYSYQDAPFGNPPGEAGGTSIALSTFGLGLEDSVRVVSRAGFPARKGGGGGGEYGITCSFHGHFHYVRRTSSTTSTEY